MFLKAPLINFLILLLKWCLHSFSYVLKIGRGQSASLHYPTEAIIVGGVNPVNAELDLELLISFWVLKN